MRHEANLWTLSTSCRINRQSMQVAARGENLIALAVLPLMARIALMLSVPQQDGLGSET